MIDTLKSQHTKSYDNISKHYSLDNGNLIAQFPDPDSS